MNRFPNELSAICLAQWVKFCLIIVKGQGIMVYAYNPRTLREGWGMKSELAWATKWM